MKDFFPRMKLQPNPNCEDENCIKRQSEYQEKLVNQVDTQELLFKESVTDVVHEDNNDYGSYFLIQAF